MDGIILSFYFEQLLKYNAITVDKIIVYIRPIEWTEGNVYGFKLHVSGKTPEVLIDWGDGSVGSIHSNEIDVLHTYPKKESFQFTVVVNVISGEVDFIDPCGGDCDISKIDFSGAPSIREIWIENCQSVVFDNPFLERLSIRIFNGNFCDLSKCPNLRQLSFEGGVNMKELNLSCCHKLESLDVSGSWQSPDFSKIVIANDAPLKYIWLSSINLAKGCEPFIKKIIERNKGELYLELLH